ncbi:M48 family metallopeptidase [Rudaeicoccus suwonensis]|uniref:YgjP-like metallopeptidase domain-containing protein n=1 Tax=Rudaeicoccus suwonensis TaxID=657409 RepID=A0A561E190_9MICO|nr:M48 family metallopeptidase [Rudaeicoccus suwonensis]TWE09395.1 hypothetical protein BKA23_3097 [Rudaeicoccus suwonensis]
MDLPPNVEVRRSARRRRTVSAYREGDRIVVLVPARITRAEESRLVAEMVRKVESAGDRSPHTDDELHAHALQLSKIHLGGLAHPASVRWVSNQNSRWGSCTPVNGTIRLSDRLIGMPAYVRDYVLLHELAHLLQPDHGRSFWALLEAYPHLERARGFLDGVGYAGGVTPADDGSGSDDADTDATDGGVASSIPD